jgi:hypothetical protein
MASAVLRTSSASNSPEMCVSPTASEPRIRARWEIDLSPGMAVIPASGPERLDSRGCGLSDTCMKFLKKL